MSRALGPIALAALAWVSAAASAQPLDLSSSGEDIDFACANETRKLCWPAPGDNEWQSVGGGWQSPHIQLDDAAILLVRLRTVGPLKVEWIKSGHAPTRVAELEPRRPSSPQLFAVALPTSGAGVIRITGDGTSRRRTRAPQLLFAEVVPKNHGRCWRDAIWVGNELRQGVTCLGGGEAVLTAQAGTRVRLGIAPETGGTNAPLGVTLRSGGREKEIAHIHAKEPAKWTDETLEVPAQPNASQAVHFKAGAAPGALLSWSCEVRRAPAPEKPNVVIYLVDTLRADAVGTYGNGGRTPNFDALAKAGAVFENTIAPSPWTLPSVVSLLTGDDLGAHGIIYMEDALPTSAVTLPRLFQRAGYATAAVTTSPWLSDRHNTHLGFAQVYDVSPERGEWGIKAGTSSARATDAALAWLERHTGEPFFLYVHVVDPHQPYTPPTAPEVKTPQVDWPATDQRWRLARSPSDGRARGSLSSLELLPRERAEPIIRVSRHLYDAAVSHADAQFGRLVKFLRERRLWRRTVTLVTSDHGEEFLEHGLTGHGHSLYGEVIRIPLIISSPGEIEAGARVSGNAGLIDLFPTVAGLAGLTMDRQRTGLDLRPAISEESTVSLSKRPLYMQRRPQSPKLPEIREIPSIDGVVHESWTLLRNVGGAGRNRWELYDAKKDPDERVNLAEKEAAARARLVRLLDQPKADGAATAAPAGQIDEATLERLRALGYAD